MRSSSCENVSNVVQTKAALVDICLKLNTVIIQLQKPSDGRISKEEDEDSDLGYLTDEDAHFSLYQKGVGGQTASQIEQQTAPALLLVLATLFCCCLLHLVIQYLAEFILTRGRFHKDRL